MKVFGEKQVREAIAYAKDGGQALHLHRILVPGAPACFRAAVNRGEDIAHLLDGDGPRLYQTAKRLGVKVVILQGTGTEKQHVDLCGAPLRRAVEEAKRG